MSTVDLNCDMGESFGAYRIGADDAVMPFITSANIACNAAMVAGSSSTIKILAGRIK